MSDAPERLWLWGEDGKHPDEFWGSEPYELGERQYQVEYVRADVLREVAKAWYADELSSRERADAIARRCGEIDRLLAPWREEG